MGAFWYDIIVVMKNNKIAKISNKILPILKKHDVIKASIFGSYVRGEEKTSSDIDVLVQFKDSKSLLDLIGLELALKK